MLHFSSETLQPHEINILIGHLTVQGGKTSDSERPLTIGINTKWMM
jgi:exonuclease SbcD